jgi:hypothetical protein
MKYTVFLILTSIFLIGCKTKPEIQQAYYDSWNKVRPQEVFVIKGVQNADGSQEPFHIIAGEMKVYQPSEGPAQFVEPPSEVAGVVKTAITVGGAAYGAKVLSDTISRPSPAPVIVRPEVVQVPTPVQD